MQHGQQLEHYINDLIASLHTLGWHAHKNNALRTINGTTLQGEYFDYEIFSPTTLHAFDAKECSHKKLRWYLSSFKNPNSNTSRQLDALSMCCQYPYVKPYFLVWFKAYTSNFLAIEFSPQVIHYALIEQRKFLTPNDGHEWSLLKRIDNFNRRL